MLATVLQAPPLAERLLVAVVGPLVSAVLGTGVIGFLLWKIAERAQLRRVEAEAVRAGTERALERERARNDLENELRHELLDPLLTTAAQLYLATQHYWRVDRDPDCSPKDRQEARRALDAQYLASRVSAAVLEAKLQAMFCTEDPARIWHAVDDLLAVRYMQLTGADTDGLYRVNARGHGGRPHSGLDVEQLRDPAALLAAYHREMDQLVPSVLSTPLRRSTG